MAAHTIIHHHGFKPRFIAICSLCVLFTSISFAQPGTPSAKLNQKLLSLPPNKWVKFHQPFKTDWHRQQHAGLAYDSTRGTLLIFGSDTHGLDWDNSVHEFDPFREQWSTHYPPAPKETYRTDAMGRAIAGTGRLLPWAMHTYDQIVYDPTMDGVVVVAAPDHNPMTNKFNKSTIYPAWFYDLKTHEWRILKSKDNVSPKVFSGASAYDSLRDVVMVYKHGMWESGPGRDHWMRATKEGHHQMHYTMEYDPKRHTLAVFGDYKNSNSVWLYTPGSTPGTKGTWQQMSPGGDPVPKDGSIPVAFDRDNGVFLLLPDNTRYDAHNKPLKARNSSTFIYDPDSNRYIKLPEGDMEAQNMNFMMAYDGFHKVFLLVTGRPNEAPTVWALKLEPDRLR